MNREEIERRGWWRVENFQAWSRGDGLTAVPIHEVEAIESYADAAEAEAARLREAIEDFFTPLEPTLGHYTERQIKEHWTRQCERLRAALAVTTNEQPGESQRPEQSGIPNRTAVDAGASTASADSPPPIQAGGGCNPADEAFGAVADRASRASAVQPDAAGHFDSRERQPAIASGAERTEASGDGPRSAANPEHGQTQTVAVVKSSGEVASGGCPVTRANPDTYAAAPPSSAAPDGTASQETT